MEHRKYRIFIISSAIITLMSSILVCVSFASNDWIHARSSVVNDTIVDYVDSIINYGLFQGTLIRSIFSSPKLYNIYFTCLWEENSCVWSCLNDDSERLNEVKALINGEKPIFSCQPLWTTRKLQFENYYRSIANGINNNGLLNAGIHLSVILLIVFTIITLFICGILGIVNYQRSPKNEIINLPGIIFLSIIAFVFNFTGLIVYGCYFNYWMKENIGILDTIVGEYKSYANLGSGYWLFLAGCLLNPVSILLIYIRNNLLMMKERTETIVVVARVNDPTTVLY